MEDDWPLKMSVLERMEACLCSLKDGCCGLFSPSNDESDSRNLLSENDGWKNPPQPGLGKPIRGPLFCPLAPIFDLFYVYEVCVPEGVIIPLVRVVSSP